MTMTGKTIKQLFKALEDSNNMKMVLGDARYDSELLDFIVYIDECEVYRGHSWKEFDKHMKKEYTEEFNNVINDILFCGSNIIIFKCSGYDYKIEIFVC